MKRDLPKRCYFQHGSYFYANPLTGKWENLGRDRAAALKAYERVAVRPAQNAMADLVDKALPVILKGRNGKGLRPNTVKQYRAAAERLKQVFAEFQPHEVKPRHVYEVQEAMQGTPNAFNRWLTVASLVFRYAVRRQIIDASPCSEVDRLEERHRDRYISDAEWHAIREHAPRRLQIMMDLAHTTGQRIGDVRTLTRRHLTDDGIMFVQEKTGKVVPISWNDDIRAAVAAALAMHGKVPGMALFFTRGRSSGVPSYKTVYDQWVRACRAAGVKNANIHDLRAKAGSDADNAGLDATAQLGHDDAKNTRRYLRNRRAKWVEGNRLPPKKLSNGAK